MNEYIPAGAGEKMQYIVHPFNDNTIRFVLRYPFLIDADILQQAVTTLVSSVDVLHSSFIAGRLGARWHINSVADGDCFHHVAVSGDPVQAALDEALQPVCASDAVQMRCVLVHGHHESAVTLLLSHLCVDGSDGKYLLLKLCEAYNLIRQRGSCETLEIKNGNRAAEQVYTHLDREDRRKLMRDPRTGIKSCFPFPTEEPGVPVVLHESIDAAAMTAAHEKAKAMGATVNDLLLTACYYAFVEVTGTDTHAPVSLMSMMDLRRHCDGGDSPGLANLTGALTTALPEGLAPTFAETLAQISTQTRRCKEDPFAGLYGMPLLHGAARKLPMGLLLSAAGRLYGSMAVGMTNVGSIPAGALQLDGISPAEGWFGGPIKKKPGMQFSIASFGGACTLCIWCHAAQRDLSALRQLLKSVVHHTLSFARDPG